MRSISSQLPSCASSRSSIRFAPAEKFGASLPTTSAWKFSRGFRDARLQHLQRIGADGVHLRVKLDGQHAVAEIDQTRAGIAPHHLLAILGRLQQLQARSGRRQIVLPESTASGAEKLLDQRRHRSRCHRTHRAPRGRRSRPRSQTDPAPTRIPTSSRDRHRRSSWRCQASRAPVCSSVGPSVRRRNAPTLS